MDIIKKGFGEQLKTLRKIKNYTQESLAEAIGINLRQLARIEAGESFVSSDTLYKICKILDVSPRNLFNFELSEELLMTGTDECVYFNVIKQDNIIRVVFSERKTEVEGREDLDDDQSFDYRMLAMAQRLQKDIFVNELEDGVEVCTKVYTVGGEIKIKKDNSELSDVERLKNNVQKIANDKKKLAYMNLAFDSLYDNKALNELKMLIKGIELMQA